MPLSWYVWASEPSEPWLEVSKFEECPSPQSTTTCHGASFAPGSEKEPRLKLWLEPSSELWPAAAVTDGGRFATVALKLADPEPPSLSVTFTVTVYEPLSE